MAKTKISEFSSTPANNTDIDSINIAEGCAPSGINDAIRELMAQLKDFQTGAQGDSFNGPIGTSTAAAGAFTTLSASGAVTLSGGTANGVAYLNGSKVVTSGSALTWSGSIFKADTGTSGAVFQVEPNAVNQLLMSNYGGAGYQPFLFAASDLRFFTGTAGGGSTSESMRLTSTGLGIGTSSPAAKLDVQGSAIFARVKSSTTTYNGFRAQNDNGNFYFGLDDASGGFYGTANARVLYADGAYPMVFYTNAAERMRIDSSGNLGLGVTPSAKMEIYSTNNPFNAFQVRYNGSNDAMGFGIGNSNGFPYLGYNTKSVASVDSPNYERTGPAAQLRMDNGFFKFSIAPSGTAGNAITFTQAMTLTANGELMVGTTTATGKASIAGAITATASSALVNPSVGVFGLYTGGAIPNTYVQMPSGGSIDFWKADTGVAARIDSSGNLLVGTTSASVNNDGFRVVNDGVTAAARLELGSASTTNANIGLSMYSTGAGAYRFYVGYGGTIYATSTSISAISDATLKENVRDLETGLTEVMALKPRRFDWKNGDAQNVAGFVAQEVEQVLPELVTDYQYSEGVTKKSLKMGDILPTLVKAIQEQQAIIDSLKARLDAANL